MTDLIADLADLMAGENGNRPNATGENALLFLLCYRAEILRNAGDAVRYRWLRDVWGGWAAIGGKMQACISTPSWRGGWPSFDAAMDAAMQSVNGGEAES